MYLAGELLLTLYLYFISYFYTLSVPLSWTAPLRLAGLYALVHYLCKVLRRVKFELPGNQGKKKIGFGLLVFFLTTLILGIYYVAYYPGGLIIDTFNQWYQVQKGYLLDWHPAIHTLLFLKIPSLICNSLAFVNFLQILWLGLGFAYLGMVMESWGIPRVWCIAAVVLGLAHPASSIVLSFCWKDTALTIFVIILTAQTLEILFSHGRWLKVWYHPVLFGLFGALAALMRHNAILLIGPWMMLVAVLFWKEIKYYGFLAGIWTLIFMGAIKGPVYKVLHVQNHPQVSAEMLGVPMTVLANVLVNEPEALNNEARDFLYRIGDQELWTSTYQEGNWNSAKWMGADISNDVIEEEGAGQVLRYTLDAAKASPYYTYRAVVKLFEVVWRPAGNEVSWSYQVNVGDNAYGYETGGVLWLQKVLDVVREISIHGNIFTTWGWNVGFFILLLLFVGISRMKSGWQHCLCWVPVLCYDFGTALLLCGPDFRFFSFNTVVTFPLILAMLCEVGGGSSDVESY